MTRQLNTNEQCCEVLPDESYIWQRLCHFKWQAIVITQKKTRGRGGGCLTIQLAIQKIESLKTPEAIRKTNKKQS